MSAPTTIPSLKQLRPLLVSILETCPFFSAISAGVEDVEPGTDDRKSVVILDDGTKRKTIERLLRSVGVCVAVMPIVKGDKRSQSGKEIIQEVVLMVRLSFNREQNESADGGAGVSMEDAIAEAQKAVTNYARHPGGEFFRIGDEAFAISRFDEGLLEYDLMFTKEMLKL